MLLFSGGGPAVLSPAQAMADMLITLTGPIYGYVAVCTMIAAAIKTPPSDANERVGLFLLGLTWPLLIGSRLIYRLIR
jgi:hypothetical protein